MALYASVEQETGQSTGFRSNGSLAIASNKGSFEAFVRRGSMASCFGREAQVVSQATVRSLHLLFETDDLVGGIVLPQDGQTSATDTAQVLARGTRVLDDARVTAIETPGQRVTSVRTDYHFL